MDYQGKRTKVGKFAYSFTMKWGRWLDKKPWLYWVLILTWGCLESIAAIAAAIVLAFSGHKKHASHLGCYFIAGNNWGGFSLGIVRVIAGNMSKEWTKHTIQHECGHAYQIAMLGPLWVFIVAIPSQIRWLIDRRRMKKKEEGIDYDAAWFEGSATELGEELCR